MAGAKKLTLEEEENRLNVRVSALDWFMHPVPEMRCRPAHEQAPDDGKRLEEMKAMLRSCPVSTVSRFIKASDAPKPVALNQKKWVDFPLEQRIDINHNTRRLRFRLPVEHLGLPVGMHIFLKGSVDGKAVMRAYTPVLVGPWFVDFIIKVYFPMPPKFPDGGVLTQHMERRSRSNPNPNPITLSLTLTLTLTLTPTRTLTLTRRRSRSATLSPSRGRSATSTLTVLRRTCRATRCAPSPTKARPPRTGTSD